MFQYDCESSPTLYEAGTARQMKDIELDLLTPHHDFPLDTELSMELTESLINTSRAGPGHGLMSQVSPLFSSCYNVQVCLAVSLSQCYQQVYST